MKTKIWLWWDYWTRIRWERFMMTVAWRLPRRIVYNCIVRGGVAAAGNRRNPGTITVPEAMEAIMKKGTQ